MGCEYMLLRCTRPVTNNEPPWHDGPHRNGNLAWTTCGDGCCSNVPAPVGNKVTKREALILRRIELGLWFNELLPLMNQRGRFTVEEIIAIEEGGQPIPVATVAAYVQALGGTITFKGKRGEPPYFFTFPKREQLRA